MWLTVGAPHQDGVELLLEPAGHPAVTAAGVVFTQPPTAMGPVTTAVLDDTCGNLIQLVSM